MEFGRNGAVLRTDKQTEREFRETRKNDFDLCVLSAAQLVGYTGVVTYFEISNPSQLADPLALTVMLVGFALAIVPSIVAFAQRAVDYEKLPLRFGGAPRYRHLSGFGIFAMLVIAAGISGLAAFASHKLGLNETFEIPESWGEGVLLAVIAAFLVAILARLLTNTPAGQAVYQITGGGIRQFAQLGRVASVLDSWLVFIIAPMAGVTQRSTLRRYMLLFCNLSPCCFLAWMLPAPAGLLPVCWAFLVAIAVARRWAWVEDDREVAMLNASFSTEKLRVGFEEDLSDETLWSYLALIILLPLTMHQFNDWAGGSLFSLRDGVSSSRLEDPVAWFTFYGTELAKAVPFVDWTEIYDVHAASAIVAGLPESRHVIFAVRAVTDLLLIATLLQTFAIAARTHKQKQLFHDPENPLDRLDPFVEPVELRKLVEFQNGKWQPVAKKLAAFPKYNSVRLHELRKDSDKDGPIYAAATALLRTRPEFSEPNERLLDAAGTKPVNSPALIIAFADVKRANAFDLETLDFVRQQLNWTSGVVPIRLEVIQAIVDQIPPSPERTNVLRRALADAQISDSLSAVRLATIEPLYLAWRTSKDRRIAAAFSRAANHDGSTQVQHAAREILKRMATFNNQASSAAVFEDIPA